MHAECLRCGAIIPPGTPPGGHLCADVRARHERRWRQREVVRIILTEHGVVRLMQNEAGWPDEDVLELCETIVAKLAQMGVDRD